MTLEAQSEVLLRATEAGAFDDLLATLWPKNAAGGRLSTRDRRFDAARAAFDAALLERAESLLGEPFRIPWAPALAEHLTAALKAARGTEAYPTARLREPTARALARGARKRRLRRMIAGRKGRPRQ